MLFSLCLPLVQRIRSFHSTIGLVPIKFLVANIHYKTNIINGC